jgi:hypothetical protein
VIFHGISPQPTLDSFWIGYLIMLVLYFIMSAQSPEYQTATGKRTQLPIKALPDPWGPQHKYTGYIHSYEFDLQLNLNRFTL